MRQTPQWSALEDVAEALQARSGVTLEALTAGLILVLGWVAALILGRLAQRGIARVVRVFATTSGRAGLRETDLERTSRAGGRVVFWLVFALAVMGATERLGMPVMTTWLSGVANYMPRVLVAILVVVVGLASARAAGSAASRAAASSGVSDTRRVARFVESTVLAVTGLVAIEALGIDISFLQVAILVALAGLLLAAALAFGLGARELVSDILACHYVQRLYRVGQMLRVEAEEGLPGIEGRVLRVVPPCVVLETPGGEVAVPARRILRGTTTHLAEPAA